MRQSIPRLVLGALRGGAGKPAVAGGAAAARRRSGVEGAPFTKGPDYIDAAWLAAAAGRPCRNLDPWLMERETILRSFVEGAEDAGSEAVALVEGNRGLFDGIDPEGTYSTAELAKLLRAPVVLVVDCTKMTATTAAAVLGCLKLDPEVELRGVILNQVATARHERIIRAAVELHCRVPVLGALPRSKDFPLPERHLGLLPPTEHSSAAGAVEELLDLAKEHLDLAALLAIAREAAALEVPDESREERAPLELAGRVRIGIVKDSAFWFYYPENLAALSTLGATLVEVSALRDRKLPELDALYIGGGFPETQAAHLAANEPFRRAVAAAAAAGLPIYAECGGAIYLGESLACGGARYPMAGVLPCSFAMEEKPQGHGYTELEVDGANPFFEQGTMLRGHEFHYTRLMDLRADEVHTVFRLRRGHGFGGGRDGIVQRNVLATYTHLHALGAPAWAAGLTRSAAEFRDSRTARKPAAQPA